jgi:pantoate--beta-alanine ligase
VTQVIHSAQALRQAIEGLRAQGKQVAFVPTMGALHQGHLELMRQGRARAGVLVASVFVNPTQFGPGEDLERYPRDLEGDVALCRQVGVDLVFAPEVDEIYPPGDRTLVRVEGLTERLCGAGRPGHFQGVTTVVTRLFNLVRPDVALFGQKDYQQLAVIRQMTRDLRWGIEIVGVPTVREDDGLALSSRNRYLSPQQRQKALGISRGLRLARALAAQGEREARRLLAQARSMLPQGDPEVRVEYLELVHPETLEPLAQIGPAGAVMLAAVRVGATRLIDNLALHVGGAIKDTDTP